MLESKPQPVFRILGGELAAGPSSWPPARFCWRIFSGALVTYEMGTPVSFGVTCSPLPLSIMAIRAFADASLRPSRSLRPRALQPVVGKLTNVLGEIGFVRDATDPSDVVNGRKKFLLGHQILRPFEILIDYFPVPVRHVSHSSEPNIAPKFVLVRKLKESVGPVCEKTTSHPQ